MTWNAFLNLTRHLPVIDAEGLLAGQKDARTMYVQLARWHKAGRLIQLKKGFYLLAEPYRKIEPFELGVSALLKTPSYLSLEKALEFHGLIPEGVPMYTALTPKRPNCFVTPLGTFEYRHIKQSLFWGYEAVHMRNQVGYVASPEKALLDSIYFHRSKPTEEWLEGLRLQNLQQISVKKLRAFADLFQNPRINAGMSIVLSQRNADRKKEKKL